MTQPRGESLVKVGTPQIWLTEQPKRILKIFDCHISGYSEFKFIARNFRLSGND